MFDAGMDASERASSATIFTPLYGTYSPGRAALIYKRALINISQSHRRLGSLSGLFLLFKRSARFYLEWLPEIKGFADQLELRQTLSLMPADDDDDKGWVISMLKPLTSWLKRYRKVKGCCRRSHWMALTSLS